MRRQLSQPSFQNGFARSIGESVRPDLWPDHAWVPAFGPTGGRVFNIANQRYVGTMTNAEWRPGGLFFGGSMAAQVDCGVPVLFSTLAAFTFSCSYVAALPDTNIVIENGSTYTTNSFMLTHGETAGMWQFLVMGATHHSVRPSVVTYPALSTINLVVRWQPGVNLFAAANGFFPALTVTNAAQTSVIDGNTNWIIGRRSASTGYTYTQTVYSNLFWPTALSNDQMLALSIDPHLPFRRRIPKRYWLASAVGGGIKIFGKTASTVFGKTVSKIFGK